MTAVAPTLTTEQQEILSRVQLHESWKIALAPGPNRRRGGGV